MSLLIIGWNSREERFAIEGGLKHFILVDFFANRKGNIIILINFRPYHTFFHSRFQFNSYELHTVR
jgi:hypothetical protein